MKKTRLDLGALSVESFPTAGPGAPARGTVHAALAAGAEGLRVLGSVGCQHLTDDDPTCWISCDRAWTCSPADAALVS